MSQVVDLEVFYPHPPERVWQVLTDRRALAAWMMENNFEPKLGHRFQFYNQSLPGLETTIQCEVVELEEPTRLVYTWQESSTEPSLVIWTLTTVTGGTQLHLKHHQYSYITAVASSAHPGAVARSLDSGMLHPAQPSSRSLGLETSSCYSDLLGKTQTNRTDATNTFALLQLQTFNWNYFLNQRLPNVLDQSGLICS